MIKYDFILKLSKDAFIEEVTEKLGQGWKLQGGASYGIGGFIQAIYKETNTTTTITKGGKK